MRRFLSIAVLALAGTLMADAANTTAARPRAVLTPPAAGQPAPDFTLLDQNGAKIHLSAERGHKVVLVFYRGYW